MTLGITASGEGYASVSTPVYAGGGVAQTFNLGNLGIGTSGTLGDVTGGTTPKWLIYAVAAAVIGFVLIKMVKK